MINMFFLFFLWHFYTYFGCTSANREYFEIQKRNHLPNNEIRADNETKSIILSFSCAGKPALPPIELPIFPPTWQARTYRQLTV